MGSVALASVASTIVGSALIVLGMIGIAAGILVAVYSAVRDALAQATVTEGVTAPTIDIPWKEIFDLLKELMKTKAGLPFVMGLVAIVAGAVVIHYSWF